MERSRWFGGAAVAAAGIVTVFSGSAFAQPGPEDVESLVSDLQIVAENAPAAAEGLAEDLQGVADTLQETQSVNQTANDVGTAGVSAGQTLIAGTEQFGDLGLGLFLANASFQQAHAPWTNAVDNQDPSVVDPADFELIAQRLQDDAADELVCGPAGGFGNGGLLSALVHLLTGNIIQAPLGIGPSFWSEGVLNTVGVAANATNGTPYVGVFQAAGITTLVVGAAVEGDVEDAEAELAPVFDAAAPATGALIEQIEAQEAENC